MIPKIRLQTVDAGVHGHAQQNEINGIVLQIFDGLFSSNRQKFRKMASDVRLSSAQEWNEKESAGTSRNKHGRKVGAQPVQIILGVVVPGNDIPAEFVSLVHAPDMPYLGLLAVNALQSPSIKPIRFLHW